jgi:hypothetical protein
LKGSSREENTAAAQVMVWDIGTYELIDGNYWQGKLHIFLSGKKLKGEWVLVKDAGRDGKDNVWYCIKAGASVAPPSIDEEDSSALSRRSMDEIAGAADAVWHSNRNGSDAIVQTDSASDETLDPLPKGKVKFIQPMLAKSVTELPQDRHSLGIRGESRWLSLSRWKRSQRRQALVSARQFVQSGLSRPSASLCGASRRHAGGWRSHCFGSARPNVL